MKLPRPPKFVSGLQLSSRLEGLLFGPTQDLSSTENTAKVLLLAHNKSPFPRVLAIMPRRMVLRSLRSLLLCGCGLVLSLLLASAVTAQNVTPSNFTNVANV